MHSGEAPAAFERIFHGIEGAFSMVAEQLGMDVAAVLGKTDLLIYGTTHATNAIIEGKTAKTALLVTEGFPEILVLREGGKTNPYDLAARYPEPYIPRRLTFEIHERIDSEGQVVIPLDRRQASQVLEGLRKRRVEAVAVCFLWSPVNPTNEAAMGRLIEEELPGVPYTLSHRLNPIIREYRRASSTAIDASLKPLISSHLQQMESDLRGLALWRASCGDLVRRCDAPGRRGRACHTSRQIRTFDGTGRGPELRAGGGGTPAISSYAIREAPVSM